MKKIYLAAIAVLSVIPFVSNAQWTTGSGIIYTTNNVGIGTSTPTTIAGYNILSINNSTGGLLDLQSGGTSKAYLYGNGGGLNIDGVGSTTPILIHTNGNEVMRITDAGNVGIGTTSPGSKLNIFDATAGNSLLSLARASNSAVKALDIKLDASENTVFTTANSDLNFTTNFNGGSPLSTMYLTYQGKVGIGTTTPDELLSVLGTIHANEVKVDLSVPGPDYVFKPDYKLPSLAEVKAYVDKNQHLSEIPSADEMSKNGLNLGDMNTKLLKKVEELTLYLIEQQK